MRFRRLCCCLLLCAFILPGAFLVSASAVVVDPFAYKQNSVTDGNTEMVTFSLPSSNVYWDLYKSSTLTNSFHGSEPTFNAQVKYLDNITLRAALCGPGGYYFAVNGVQQGSTYSGSAYVHHDYYDIRQDFTYHINTNVYLYDADGKYKKSVQVFTTEEFVADASGGDWFASDLVEFSFDTSILSGYYYFAVFFWVIYAGIEDETDTTDFTFTFRIDEIEQTIPYSSSFLSQEEEKKQTSWLGRIWESITNLPQNISNSVKGFFDNVVTAITNLGDYLLDGIKSLFIPGEEDMTAMKDKWEQLLSDRFGAVYESTAIIDDWANAFTYSETKEDILFPEVSVNLAGTNFIFGGWTVDIIPDAFEGIIDTLKMIINIACTFLFVNGMKKRLEGVLS